ncbi:metal-sensitive transcriptional regulator [Microbacterium sp. APC 3901]|uniref:metal-sensitive transcriptional regulator n=1 Tax=Microbacterium sp. APC 3901 TaxID=3035192 RepID=UPI0025B2E254|nr:metal-sensitive transcriptional regulator [Microbacterium sp. APC 3901]MDN3444299.1 metal-sensitive transcriptional regulator [Microbacterium sp. APC 3901]
MTTTDPDVQRKILNRLKRAQGQLAAVISAVEREDDCRTVVTQLSAVSSALDRAGFQIIATAMKDCLAEPGESTDGTQGEVSMSELEKLFLSLA